MLDRDIIYDDRKQAFTILVKLEESNLSISRNIVHYGDSLCRWCFRRNGEYKLSFDNLSFGVRVVDKNKNIVFSKESSGYLSTDQISLEEYAITGLTVGEDYTLTAWYEESSKMVSKSFTISVYELNENFPETYKRSAPNKMIYMAGYYPSDEKWEEESQYHEEGQERPLPPSES